MVGVKRDDRRTGGNGGNGTKLGWSTRDDRRFYWSVAKTRESGEREEVSVVTVGCVVASGGRNTRSVCWFVFFSWRLLCVNCQVCLKEGTYK